MCVCVFEIHSIRYFTLIRVPFNSITDKPTQTHSDYQAEESFVNEFPVHWVHLILYGSDFVMTGKDAVGLNKLLRYFFKCFSCECSIYSVYVNSYIHCVVSATHTGENAHERQNRKRNAERVMNERKVIIFRFYIHRDSLNRPLPVESLHPKQ